MSADTLHYFMLFLVSCIVFVHGEDDGQYRPEEYSSDDGKYHPEPKRYPSNTYNPFVFRNTFNSRAFGNYYKNPYFGSYPYGLTGIGNPSIQKITQQAPISTVSGTAVDPIDSLRIAKYRFDDRNARILSSDNINNVDTYQYGYLNDNAIAVQESGTAGDPYGTRATGFYEYVGDNGIPYRVDYTADENGFKAYGAHLPTPPPIPEAIARSLRQRGLSPTY